MNTKRNLEMPKLLHHTFKYNNVFKIFTSKFNTWTKQNIQYFTVLHCY